MWMQDEAGRQIPSINTSIEAAKANGVYDMRGFGDGHSFSGGYSDAYGNQLAGEEGRVGSANTTFQGEPRPVSAAAAAATGAVGRTHRNEEQSETHF